MRFFTPAWHRGELTEEEARGVWPAYEAHLMSLGPTLPREAYRLSKEVSLHDALIRHVVRVDGNLELLCRTGDVQEGYSDLRLSYGAATLSGQDEAFLKSAINRPDIEVLYDEFDAADGRWVHRLLFWPYREVALYFETFHVRLTRAKGRSDPNVV